MKLFTRPQYYKTFLELSTPKIFNETKFEKQFKQTFNTPTGIIPQKTYDIWAQHAEKNSLTRPSNVIDIPYNFEGVNEIPEIQADFLIKNLFSSAGIQKADAETYFGKMYVAFLYALAENNNQFFHEYCETRFGNKVIESLDKIQELGDELITIEDYSTNNDVPFNIEIQYIDGIIIKGLNIDREKNGNRSQYTKYNDQLYTGLIDYSPKDLANPKAFLDQQRIQTVIDQGTQLIARVLYRVVSPIRLKLNKSNGQSLYLDNYDYSYNHLVLLECQLEKRPFLKSFTKLENYQQWLGNQIPRVWKIADIDGWFKSNPLFLDPENIELEDEIFKGTSLDPNVINIRRG